MSKRNLLISNTLTFGMLSLLAFLGLPTLVTAAELDPAVAKIEADRIAAVEKATPSVVAIFANGGNGGGSGVIVTPDGYALSNFHVTKPAGTFMKCGLADGKLYDAVIVGIDPVGDVALIKLHGRTDFTAAELADSDEVQVGDFCFAMGNPFLLATDFTPSISYGVVSGTHRYQYPAGTFLEYADCIQTDAAINPGNSGGPLFDSKGRLIGINGRGSFEKRGRVNVGVGYAISINQIKKFMGALRSGRILDHATLGAQLTTSDSGKVTVTNILEQSDANRRGLMFEDEVISFAGRPIRTVNAYKNILGTFPRDWRVPMTVRRNGTELSMNVRLQGVNQEAELLAILEGSENPEDNPKRKPGDPVPKPRGKKNDPEKKPSIPKIQLDKLFNKEAGPPAELKKQYEAREGYVNYYFNKVEQDRLWKSVQALGDFSKIPGDWVLSGELNKGSNYKLTLGREKTKIELPVGDSEANVGGLLNEEINPPGSGGLLAALHLWKRYLVEGPGKFGQLVYVGTMPWPGIDNWCDVLVGTTQGVDIRFYFDPATKRLAALEFFSQDNEDPCEVTILGYQEIEGRQWPSELSVRYAERVFGQFKITKIEASDKLAPKAAAEPPADAPE